MQVNLNQRGERMIMPVPPGWKECNEKTMEIINEITCHVP